MKKVLLALLLLVGFTATIVSCEKESTDEDIELFGPDKDKSNCTGCNQ